MASLKINRLTMGLRAGDDMAQYCISWMFEKGDLLDELELFEDFETLKMLLCSQITQFLQTRKGFIYVADSDGEYLKVGRTCDLGSREKSLNSAGVFHELRFIETFSVIDSFTYEAKLHSALKEKFPKKKEFFLGNKESILELTRKILVDLTRNFQVNARKIGLDIQYI